MIVTGGFKHIIPSFNLILVGKRRACCRRCPTGKPGTHLPKGSVRGSRSVWEIESPEAVPREFIIRPARCRRGGPARLPLLGGRGSRCAPAEAAAGAGGAVCPAGHRLGSAPPPGGPAGGAGRDVPLEAGGGVGTVPLLRTSRTARPSLPACCRPAMVPSSERLFDSLGHFGRYRGPALTGGQACHTSPSRDWQTPTQAGYQSYLPPQGPTGTRGLTRGDVTASVVLTALRVVLGGSHTQTDTRTHTHWHMHCTHALTHTAPRCINSHCTDRHWHVFAPLYTLLYIVFHTHAAMHVYAHTHYAHTPVYMPHSHMQTQPIHT